ncbi:MAG: hypothetical protein LBH98_09185 [Chitinispirillales bacterium]|jgi:hypothetical protein|nr:hypothetical protein [Chitinispirillales bacterium]
MSDTVMCPYYQTEYKLCNFFGTYQENREYNCLDSYNWKQCANYTNRSLEDKVAKRLRPNPDL